MIKISLSNHLMLTELSVTDAAKELGWIVIVQALCIGVGLGLLLVLAVIYDAAYRSMSWFSNPWLLFGIYVCPLFFCLGIGPSLYIMFRKKVCIVSSSGLTKKFYFNFYD